MKRNKAPQIYDLPRKPIMHDDERCAKIRSFIHFIHYPSSSRVIRITRQTPIIIIISRNNIFMRQEASFSSFSPTIHFDLYLQ